VRKKRKKVIRNDLKKINLGLKRFGVVRVDVDTTFFEIGIVGLDNEDFVFFD